MRGPSAPAGTPKFPSLWIALNGVLALSYLWRLTDIARRQEVLATDFAVFFTGWSLIVRGRGHLLYDVDAQRTMQQAIVHPFMFRGGLMAFLTPPHAALALAPLAWLDIHVGFILWTVVQIVLLVLFARALLRLLRVDRPAARALVVSALAGFWPVFYTLHIGQLSIVLVLAFIQLFFALGDRRPRRAAAWLLVLSLKPQLLPFLLVWLLAWKSFDVLGWAAVFGTAAVALSSSALGIGIWRDYFAGVTHLETFFGDGVPRFMMNLRGAVACLAAMAGRDGDRLAARVAWGTLVAALPFAYLAWRRSALIAGARAVERAPASLPVWAASFAQATAVALFLSPHLFMQDTLSWTVPLAIFYRQQAPASAAASRVARFALAWPLVFAVSVVVDNALHRQPVFNAALVLIIVLMAWMAFPARGPDADAQPAR